MATRKSSGADMKSGNDLMRSTTSRGMSGMVEAVSGEGRTGRVGFVSTLKERRTDETDSTACGCPVWDEPYWPWWCARAR